MATGWTATRSVFAGHAGDMQVFKDPDDESNQSRDRLNSEEAKRERTGPGGLQAVDWEWALGAHQPGHRGRVSWPFWRHLTATFPSPGAGGPGPQ